MDGESRASREPSNPNVVAAAGAAAGLLAGLVVAVGRLRDEPAVADPILVDGAATSLPTSGELARELGRRFAADVRDAAARAEQQARLASVAAQQRAADLSGAVDRAKLVEAGAAVERLGERAGKAADRGVKKGRDVRKQAGRKAKTWRKQAAKQAEQAAKQARAARKTGLKRTQFVRGGTASAAQAVAAQAAAAAAARAERTRAQGRRLAGSAKERLPAVGQSFADEFVPPLRDAAIEVAGSATRLWQDARERATVAARDIDLEAPTARVRGAARLGAERALSATADARLRATSATTNARRSRAVAGEVAGRRGKRASEGSPSLPRRAAGAAVGVTKDTGALALWGGAAGALVYYALLSPEQRAQVTRSAQTVSTQVQELVRDFRGYDDEF